MNFKRIISTALVTAFAVTSVSLGIPSTASTVHAEALTKSEAYAAKMGHGWNLGNSFDGFDTGNSNLGGGETAWGNPVVTKQLLEEVKDKGYDSIRMPFTVNMRYTEDNGTYTISSAWLSRYKEVVDWASDLGLYVVINMHHDSWAWLSSWDGSKDSKEYQMYTQFYQQIADYFKDEGDNVAFETINEPAFSATGSITAEDKLEMINSAAYDIIRKSGGNNETRMILMPSLNTNHEESKTGPLSDFIRSLNDENVIATVHYYSDWVYSANLGETGFDESVNGGSTPRQSADSFFSILQKEFTDNGIGVVVGEYGLLGYDSGSSIIQKGEELKYYEYMNSKADDTGICLMFWDNGSGIDRSTGEFKDAQVGSMLEACNRGERSSYVTGLDTIYFTEAPDRQTLLPLTLNGNTFTGIKELTRGSDYSYRKSADAVVLKESTVSRLMDGASDGTFATLTLQFSSGSDCIVKLVKCETPVYEAATGSKSDGITIPVSYNGNDIRRISANSNGTAVGPNSSWWKYLQYGTAYVVNTSAGTLQMKNTFFADSSVSNGSTVTLSIEYYNGETGTYTLQIGSDGSVTGNN